MRSFWSHILMVSSIALAGCASAPEAENLSAQTRETGAYVAGVPGGIKERITTLTATVKAVDFKNRTVTLQDQEGNIKTFPVPKEAINFDQVEKGDRVTITIAEELIVSLKDKGSRQEDGSAVMAGRLPAGNKPRALVAEGRDETAVVTAVDLENHAVTLKFPDGRTRTIRVRDDVELKKSHVGVEVLFQYREATALSVEKVD